MDTVAEKMKEWDVKYRYLNLNEVNSAKLTVGRNGEYTMTCVVPNAEYPINIDFSTICKKRRDMTEFFNRLARTPGRHGGSALNEIDLSPANIKSVNDILKEAGYETACFGCFVESKRYGMKAFATSFVDMWNGAVDAIRAENGMDATSELFDFAGGQAITNADLDRIDNELKAYNGKGKYKVTKTGNMEAKINTRCANRPRVTVCC